LAGLSSGYFRLRAGYRLPAGKHTGILTHFHTKINKKTAKNELFPHPACPARIRCLPLYPVLSSKLA
jgi:hypothetical protein